ncbi:MAG: putative salt-induced outer membrane protein YdiY [Psychrosphaera sp.]|jgi:putative salt-induced outer membrane protein
MKFVTFFAALIFLLNASTVSARFYDESDSFELEPLITDSTLDISAELGALFTTGNAESTSILSKLALDYEMNNWRHKYSFESLYKQDAQIDSETNTSKTVTSAEKYKLNAEAYYKITETKSALVFWGNEFDRFGQYTSISTLVLGYNFRAIDGSLIKLDLNVAPGFTFIESEDGSTQSAPVLRGSGVYKWTINSNTRFTQTFTIETSEINTRAIIESSLTAKLHGSMQMKVSYKATSDDDVDDTLAHINTQTSVTLVVNF